MFFDLLIQIFGEIASLIFQVSWGHQFLTEVKKSLDLGIFRLGLSNFWLGACFPFDIQASLQYLKLRQSFWLSLYKTLSKGHCIQTSFEMFQCNLDQGLSFLLLKVNEVGALKDNNVIKF